MTNENIQIPVYGEVSPELSLTTGIPASPGAPIAPADIQAANSAVRASVEDTPDLFQPVGTEVATGQPVAETNAPPTPPTSPAHQGGPNWTWPVVALVAIAAVVWVGKKLKANTAAFEKSVEDDLVDTVLDVVAKDAPDRAVLRKELADVVANGGTLRMGPLAAILRIEDGYEKKSPGRYLRRISVFWRKEGTTGSLGKIECELGWEYIPEAVREEFIKTRQEKVVRLVYDGKGGGT